MKYKIFAFLFLGSFLAGCHGQDSPSNTDIGTFVQKKIDSLYHSEKLPGIFIGILHKGEKSFFTAGYANPDPKIIFDSATIFEIGSITKTFTAFVLEKVLAEKGIPDTVSILPYLPDSVQANKSLASINFLSLMNHSSGLPRLPGNMDLQPDSMNPYDNYGTDKLFSFLKSVEPKPDGLSNYSNLGVGLAGILAERISGKNYLQLLQENILLPFKMNTVPSGNAQGHFESEQVKFWEMKALASAGNIKMNANDMLTYLSFMAEPGDEAMRKTRDLLLKPTISLSPTLKIGRSWMIVGQKDKSPIYWHNGGTYGFSTFAAFDKDNKNALIVVTNEFNKNELTDFLGLQIMQKLASL